MKSLAIAATLFSLISPSALATETMQPSALIIAQSSCSGIPKVDPWKLPKAVLLGNAKAANYYKRVVLAGDTERVQRFLDCYNLTTKWRFDYASARPIWAACQQIMGPGGERGSQMVCVAVDSGNQALDPNIFSKDYADKVAAKAFNWF